MRRDGMAAAGWALVGSAALTMLMMGHHPTSAHDAVMGRLVHGVLIGFAGVTAYGFFHWSRLRGLDRPVVAMAVVAYLLALAGHVGAATISGFVVTALAEDGVTGRDMHHLVWESHQALAGLGVFATGAAYMLWSIDLLLRAGGGRWERLTGLLGLALGLVPPVLIAAGMLRMNLHGAMIIYGAEMVWMAALGLLMLALARAEAR